MSIQALANQALGTMENSALKILGSNLIRQRSQLAKEQKELTRLEIAEAKNKALNKELNEAYESVGEEIEKREQAEGKLKVTQGSIVELAGVIEESGKELEMAEKAYHSVNSKIKRYLNQGENFEQVLAGFKELSNRKQKEILYKGGKVINGKS